MTELVPFPIVGGAYSDETKPWSAQETVNWIPEAAERPGGRSESMLRAAPGLAPFCDSMEVAPVRGLHDVEGLTLAVTGRGLYRVSPSGTPTYIGEIPGTGRVSMAHNAVDGGNEVVIANGSSGYLYSTKTDTLSQITDPGFPGSGVADFVDGYIAGVEPRGRFWFTSDLRKAGEYNTLDRQDAEALPDRIVGLIVSHREVFVQGTRSGQFFRNTGAATGTFQNANGTEMEVGLASPFASARLDNTVYWAAPDATVYRLAGNQPQRVSTGPIEQALSKCDLSRAFAFTYEDRGHKIFYLTCPDGQTFGYDVWTNEWHRRQSSGLQRWRVSTLVKSGGLWIAGDFANGKLYRVEWGVGDEDGVPIERRRVSGVIHNNQNELILNAVELVFDTGFAPPANLPPPGPPAALTLTGNMSSAMLGSAVAGRYAAHGGRPPFEFSVASGTPPPGVTIQSDGRYSGTYSEAGDYSWTMQVVDSDSVVATLADTATVGEPIPYDAIFRYYTEDTGPGGSTVFAEPDFDDSAWALGQGGFGNPESASLAGHTLHTPVAGLVGRNLWLRKASAATGQLRVDAYHDDGCMLFWNGELIELVGDAYFHGYAIIPADKVTGDDVLALRVIDGYIYDFESGEWTASGSANIYAAIEISAA